MNEAKLTKGEWSILPIEESKEYIRIRGTGLGGRYKVANVIDLKNHHDKSSWCKREREESKANAHLIAAAPEMYAEIESEIELLKEVRGDSHSEYLIALLDERIANKQSLLAKARGES